MTKKLFISILGFLICAFSLACSKDGGEEVYCTVTFDTDGGKPVPQAQRIEKGKLVTAPTIAPQKPGFVFVYWSEDRASPYNFYTPVTRDLTLRAKWEEDASGEFEMFSSIEDLYHWLQKQPFDKEYKVGLRGIDLDRGDNWSDVRRVIKAAAIKNQSIILNLKGCTGRKIPDGHWEGSQLYATFNELRNLEKIILPESLKVIGKYAFYKSGISEIEFPNQLQVIGRKAFLGCYLSAIEFPAALQEIGEAAFVSCRNLASIKLPRGLQKIGENAFEFSGLETVTIPDPAIEIGNAAFSYCPKLTRVTLPEGMIFLGYWFVSNESLQSINIPSTVKEIGKLALSGCKSLPAIVIPDGVIKIGDGAFLDCTALPSIKLPESLKDIGGGGVFHGCSFSSIEIPKGVQTIGNEVLGKSAITQIRMMGETPPVLAGELYSIPPFVFQIRVPASAIETYKKAKGWEQYADKISAL